METEKSVLNLQVLCLTHICRNLPYYVRIYRSACAETKGEYKDELLYQFHLTHGEKILYIIRNRNIISDSDIPTAKPDFIDFNLQDGTELTEENYLTFLIHPHLKNLSIGFEEAQRKTFGPSLGKMKTNSFVVDLDSYYKMEKRPFKISSNLLITISKIGKNLSTVNMQGCDIAKKDFDALLKAIPNIECLDLSHTCFSDLEMSMISKHCPLLKILILAGTDITDEGMKYLSDTQSTNLIFIDIDETDITVKGTRKALESFKFLEALRYTPCSHLESDSEMETASLEKFFLNSSISNGIVGVPWTLHHINKENANAGKILDMRKYALKELIFGICEMKLEFFETAVACCPTLKSLMILPNITADVILQCSKFSNLREMRIYLGEHIPKDELREFFSLGGHRLEVLDFILRRESESLYYDDILNWLKFCTKLKSFSCLGFFVEHESLFAKNPVSHSFPFLDEIVISDLGGSATIDFLSFLLCASPSLENLWLFNIENPIDAPLQNPIDAPLQNPIDAPLQDAKRLHNFRLLHELKFYSCAVSSNTLLEFFAMENLKYLEYPFAENGMTEVLEQMLKKAKEENMKIVVSDCYTT